MKNSFLAYVMFQKILDRSIMVSDFPNMMSWTIFSHFLFINRSTCVLITEE